MTPPETACSKSWENTPTRGMQTFGTFTLCEQKWQISAVFRVWHTSCNVWGMERDTVFRPNMRRKNMTMTNDFTGKVFAAIGAFAITMTMLVASFDNPTTSAVTTLLA